ncbi:MAG TPA: hypothetical protein VGF79_00905 [Bacteroidia bacterium]
MKPKEFKGQNVVFGANQPEYQPLPALRIPETGEVITCWQMTDEEFEEVSKTRCVYLQQLTFNQPLQPVYLSSGLHDLAKIG